MKALRAVEGLILRALTTYALLQAGLFLIVALIVALPAVRRRHDAALSQAPSGAPGGAASFRGRRARGSAMPSRIS